MELLQKLGNKFWGYNTEPIFLPKIQSDCFITVASGFYPWIYAYTYFPKKIIFCDINEIGIQFQKWFLQNYMPNKTWEEHITIFGKEPFSNKSEVIDESNKLFEKIKPTLTANWKKIKELEIIFITDNIITNNEILVYMANAKKPVIWLSNIFCYKKINKKYTNNEIKKYLSLFLKQNRNIYWFGYGLDRKQIVTYNDLIANLNVIRLPTFDNNKWLDEIKLIDNLFVKHRTKYGKEWYGFTIHGIDSNITQRGDESKYTWTHNAQIFLPSIVKYFQDNKIRNNYGLIRIMKLNPGGLINIHNDIGFKVKPINIAINHPDDCNMYMWNEYMEFIGKVPWKEGKAFEMDLDLNHMVVNNSSINRYHIIVHEKL